MNIFQKSPSQFQSGSECGKIQSKTGHFELGLNFWASHAATRMWTDWDPETVRKDLECVAKAGFTLIRICPIWADFQPVMTLRTNCYPGGFPRAYAFPGEQPLPDTPAGRAGVSETMMERFEFFADTAGKYGLRLIVPLITGHMTFRVYAPPAVDGLDHFRDPESLMWQNRFIRYFVTRMKHHPAIAAWELGNEANCMSRAETRAAAYAWTAFVTNAIRACDPDRPICSGMHGLKLADNPYVKPGSASWTFSDQAELCDLLTTHPYPMWRDYICCDPANTLRFCLMPAAENQLYADLGGKPSFIEESGTLRRTFSTFEALGRQLRSTLYLAWRSNASAFLWWCSFDQRNMEFPPYDWEGGMEHGAFTEDRKINPTGQAMSDFAAFMKRCSAPELPPARTPAVVLLSKNHDIYPLAHAVNALAAQAGIPTRFVAAESSAGLPDSDFYLMPCVRAKGGLTRALGRELLRRVSEGATLYFSFDRDVNLTDLPDFCGFEIARRTVVHAPAKIAIDGIPEFEVPAKYRFDILPGKAHQLDRDGWVWEYPLGRGRIVTVTLPLELAMLAVPESFQTRPAFRLYELAGAEMQKRRILRTDDCEVLISEHPESADRVYAVLCNASPADRKTVLHLTPGWRISACESDLPDVILRTDNTLVMPGNSGALLTLCRE